MEPLLLHPLVRENSPLFCCPSYRRKTSSSKLFCPRHPYGGHNGGQFNNLGNRQQLDPKYNEDSHYRWPSPSLPPTLKKGATMSNSKQTNPHSYGNNGGGGGGMGRGGNHIVGSTHPHHNYENYDTYEMEQQYYKTASNRIFQKNNKGRGGGGTLDHRVHPERTAVNNSDFNLYAESTKKNKRYVNNNSPDTEEILDEFGDVVVVRSRPNHKDNIDRRNIIKNSSLKNMSDSSGGGQITSTTSAAFNDDSSEEGWTTEF